MSVQNITIAIVLMLVGAGALYVLFQPSMSSAPSPGGTIVDKLTGEPEYATYNEIENPSGFVNTEPFALADIVGEQVILLDFMTYSCINCIRTFPYLVAWDEAYRDQGLTIVGIHTPEFAFERDIDNVREAMEKHGIEFPIVLDNDYSTWRAWGNRYWPRKYLIDINGNVVYDHIGEGAYEETEAKIVELLEERAAVLGGEVDDMDITVNADTRTGLPQSPETYLGALRGDYDNTVVSGQDFTAPVDRVGDRAYLSGDWRVTDEFVEPVEEGSSILYNFQAKKVFLVMTSDTSGRVRVLVDGEEQQIVTVTEEDLYTLVEMPTYGNYELELEFLDTDVRAFAFTFG